MVAKFENSTYPDINKYKEYRKKSKKRDRENFLNGFNNLKQNVFFAKQIII